MKQVSNFRVDLHTHSSFSDGSASVKQLVEEAKKADISMLSLTDHDTVAGLPSARELCQKAGIEFIPGVEISCKFANGGCHMLGYFVDEKDKTFHQNLSKLKNARNARNGKIIAKLNTLGVDISEEELISSLSPFTVIGRPHIAGLLVKKKYASSTKDAFKKFLANDAPAYVDKEVFTPLEALQVIKNCGGQPFLAHPVSLRLSRQKLIDFCTELKAKGLTGIEAFNSAHDANQTKQYLAVAKQLDLQISGGSDFHGEFKPHVSIGQATPGYYIMSQDISASFLQNPTLS